MKDKIRITITVILVVVLMLIVALLGYALVLIFVNDMISNRSGIISILAFLLAAFIFGSCMNLIISYIKRLWE